MRDPFYQDESVTVYHGDCLDVLAELPDSSVDSVVTDPPYGLEFMGKDWDRPWAVSPTQSVGFANRENNLTLPSFNDNRNANCRACGGRQRGKQRCECAAPQWDRDPTADLQQFGQWCQLWATECLRVLKPGGHLLAFGGTRTWHRLAVAIEDAGFQIRDNIAWIYGSGFPKSMDVSKAIDKAAGAEREVVGRRTDGRYAYGFDGTANRPTGAAAGTPDAQRIGGFVSDKAIVTAPATPEAQRWQGWGTALKPAFEPIVVARKPLTGTVAANVLAYGTGALNIDACRVPTNDKLGGGSKTKGQQMKDGWHRPWMDDPQACANNAARHRERVAQAEELGRWPANVTLDPDTAAQLDKQSGITKTPTTITRGGNRREAYGMERQDDVPCYGDEGGASRFFPTFRYQAKAATDERPTHNGITHPTVKPLDLMRWLVRLVTPPNGTVLEPFAGSGTTAEACIHEHMKCVAIERETDYLPLIVNRLTKPIEIGFNFQEGS